MLVVLLDCGCGGIQAQAWLPGGERTTRSLNRLAEVYAGFEGRYAHTPYLQAVRRTGLARFHLVYDPKHRPYGRKIPPSEKEETVTLPERPKRPERPGGRPTSGGTTTGG